MNSETLLYRQIHPSFVQLGRVTSQAFRPTPKDEQKFSVYDGDQISAGDAYDHYTTSLEYSSCGVMGLLCAECETLALPVQPDPEPFLEHAVIDFAEYSKKQTEKKAKQLKAKAAARGWLHGGEGV